MGNKEIFDQIAGRYETPDRVEIAALCTGRIKASVDRGQGKCAMDFGCGTGLVGLNLTDTFDSLLLVDISPNMVHYVKEKIKAEQIQNADAACFNLEVGEKPLQTVDYILVVQTLLHINDTFDILQKLHSLLNAHGHLIIVDFNKNDTVVSELIHNGFEQNKLADLLRKAGFDQIKSETFYSGKNLLMNQDASLFIMDAEKPADQ